jgi:hypothetical protein
MKIAVLESKWNKFRQNSMNPWNQRRNDQIASADSAQERSISILQKRYGFTTEQATSEFKKHYSKARLGENHLFEERSNDDG